MEMSDLYTHGLGTEVGAYRENSLGDGIGLLLIVGALATPFVVGAKVSQKYGWPTGALAGAASVFPTIALVYIAGVAITGRT